VSDRALRSSEASELASLLELDQAAHRYAAASRSRATRDAYEADWRDFTAWCQLLEVPALPAAPSTLRQYFAQLAQRGVKAATIARRVAAISKAHQLAGISPPPTREETVKATLTGIRRTIGTAAASKAGISIGGENPPGGPGGLTSPRIRPLSTDSRSSSGSRSRPCTQLSRLGR
jgi:hypothetical protein